MNKGMILIFALSLCVSVRAQSDLQQMFDTEKAFERAAAERGVRTAYLEYLADDAVIFRPDARNGKEFWKARTDNTSRIVRRTTFSDISSGGMLGYTTGSWERFTADKPGTAVEYGQFATIWEKRADGRFKATVDIGISHDAPPPAETEGRMAVGKHRDINQRGWSAADPSMNFLRRSMTGKAAGGAYDKFAADDIRLLRDGEPPIIGKKNAVRETKNYRSLDYPKKVALFQSADMAYVWNPCVFANNDEGTQSGNCLQVWKLRDKKWQIVLSVFARLPNETRPVLKSTSRGKNRK